MSKLFTVKTPGGVFLPEYLGTCPFAVGREVVRQARKTGYQGHLRQRLQGLNWEIVECKFVEVRKSMPRTVAP